MKHLDPSGARTLTELLRSRADLHPDAVALRFFERGEKETHKLSYGELDAGARAVAMLLRERVSAGDRVLLMFPPGLDFLVSFCACLYVGATAVPAYPPEMHRLEHAVRRLQAVIDDAKPAVVVTTPEILAMAGPLAAAVSGAKRLFETPWIADAHDLGTADQWAAPNIGGETLAFLQYTSGSTGNPKGAMLSHRNLLKDLHMLQQALDNPEYRPLHALCWVPLYHDLGLIGHALSALYSGGTCSIMSPLDFLKKPVRWLRLLSETGAQLSGGPNFGFELCLRKISPDEIGDLDLSRVEHLANCAEPVRARTIEQFNQRFAPAGLKRSALTPCYGLAEATVMVTCTSSATRQAILHVDEAALAQHRVEVVPADGADAVALVGCGKPWDDCEVVIVAPNGERAAADTVGEIWVRGSNVARGYWQRPEASEETFGGRLEGQDGAYLRTGDLGFFRDDELYVTGRRKDLVIVRGRNLYPQDIERAVDELRAEVPQIRMGCSAAFAWTVDNQEELVLLQEVSAAPGDNFDARLCVSEIRRGIFEAFEVQPYEVVLLASGTIPKTSSGKIMRSACRDGYGRGLSGGVIQPVYRERDAAAVRPAASVARPASSVTMEAEPAPISIMAPKSTWDLAHLPAPGSEIEPSLDSRKHADDMLDWLRDWAPARFDPRLADTRRSLAPHVLLDLGNAGVLGMRVPPRWGGHGLCSLDAARVIQQLAAIDLSLAALATATGSLGVHPIVRFAGADLRDALLPDLASGRRLAAFALTERGAGSNPLAMQARAVGGLGGPWRLRGKKTWVGLAAWAGVVNVFVRHEKGVEGVSAFAVPQPAPGMRVGPEAMTLGLRSMAHASLLLDGVEVGERELLGVAGRGFDVAVSAMSEGRLMIASAAVGGMKRALQLMARYAERRNIGTGLLFDNPVTRARMAQATFGALALEALVTRLATLRDGGANLPSEVFSAAKVAGAELLWKTADQLVQLLGGRGYAEPNDAARLLRDARALRIFEGSSETLWTHLGASLLRSTARWRALVTGSLRAPRTAVKLGRASDELKAALGERPAVDTRRLIYCRAGKLLCWAMLAAGLEGRGARQGVWAQAGAWLAERFDAALREAVGACAAVEGLPGKAELRTIVDEFINQIGDLEVASAGEDSAQDDDLRKTPAVISVASSQPVAPIAIAPAPKDGRSTQRSSGQRESRQAPARPDNEATLISWANSITEESKEETPSPSAAPPPEQASDEDGRRAEVEQWLGGWVSRTLGIASDAIDVNEPLTSYGVDSLAVLEATADIETQFKLELQESVFWNHRTIAALSRYIARQLQGASGG